MVGLVRLSVVAPQAFGGFSVSRVSSGMREFTVELTEYELNACTIALADSWQIQPRAEGEKHNAADRAYYKLIDAKYGSPVAQKGSGQ